MPPRGNRYAPAGQLCGIQYDITNHERTAAAVRDDVNRAQIAFASEHPVNLGECITLLEKHDIELASRVALGFNVVQQAHAIRHTSIHKRDLAQRPLRLLASRFSVALAPVRNR